MGDGGVDRDAKRGMLGENDGVSADSEFDRVVARRKFKALGVVKPKR